MKEVGYYRRLEEKYQRKGMGDKIDGLMVTKNMPIYMLRSNEKFKLPTPEYTYSGFVGDEKVPVFCASLINDKVLMPKNNDEAIVRFKKDPYGQDMKTIFGEYFILLHADKFVRRVTEEAEKKGIKIQSGVVEYRDFDNCDNNWLPSYEGSQFGGFKVKDSFFDYQNEFRLIIENKRTGRDTDHFELEIGCIRDMAIMMGKTSDFLESTLALNGERIYCDSKTIVQSIQ